MSRSAVHASGLRIGVVVALVAGLLAAGGVAFGAGGDLEWARHTVRGTASNQPSTVAVDSAGNVYTGGTFNGTADFDPGVGTANLISAGSSDGFVIKLDHTGDVKWARHMGGSLGDSVQGVAVDTAGNVYATGIFRGTADFDPDVTTHNLEAAGDADVFVWKLSPTGDLVWARRVGGGGADRGLGIAVDTSGNVYVTGDFSEEADFDPGVLVHELSSVGSTDAFVLKLNSAGALVWVKQVGGTGGDEGGSIAVDAAGNVYVAGGFTGTVDFDPGAGVFSLVAPGSGTDAFVMKLDSSGNLVGAWRFGGTSPDLAEGLAVDAAGNIFVTGRFEGTADFDPGAGTSNLTAVEFSDGFVVKLAASGAFAWVRQLGSSSGRGEDIAVDLGGSVYTTGVFSFTVDFEPGPGVTNLTSAGDEDAFAWKLDSDGGLVWARRFGGTTLDRGRAIAVSAEGNAHIAGNFSGTADFDPGPGTHEFTSSGGQDAFLVRLATSDTDGDGFPDPLDNFPTVYSKCRDQQATIIGTEGPDVINGTAGPDVIMGFGGNDTIYGHGGNDLICAGGGDDTVYGGDGRDKIYGENGHDALYGELGSDWLYGGNGNDNLQGGKGTRDKLFGGGGSNLLNGGAGDADQCTLGPTFKNCEVIF